MLAGELATGGLRTFVVRESDGQVTATLSRELTPRAISPDGTRIAYFMAPAYDELWLADTADLDHPRRLLSISPRFTGGLVWSTDGNGILFTSHTRERVPGVESAPLEARLEGLHLDTDLRESFAERSEISLRPLLWAREQRVVAAVGGFGQKGPGDYLVVDRGAAKTSSLPDATRNDVTVAWPQASSDARWVSALVRYGTTRTVLRVWPSEDLGRAIDVEPAGRQIRSTLWRPGTSELAVDVDGTLEVWARDGTNRRQIADLAGNWLHAFRWDGTAIYAGREGGRPGIVDLIEIGTGRRVPLPAAIETVWGSVRLP
ncbi:MAG: hypothetical protein ABI717_08260 [Actinomycetota bacterium]